MAHHPVVLYAIRECPTCERARTFFRERGVAFTELDVTSDAQIVRDLTRMAGEAVVPTIVVGDDVQVGWDASRVAEMIDDPLPDEEDQLTVIFEEIERELEEEERQKKEELAAEDGGGGKPEK